MPGLNDAWLPGPPVPSVIPATPIEVLRLNGSAGSSSYEPMPHLECSAVAIGEWPDPGTAHFRYRWNSGVAGAPNSAEQALTTATTYPKAVGAGDRLVVRATRPDGSKAILFDGFALGFGLELRGQPYVEEVPLTAVGVAVRCWDLPIGGALQRGADAPATVADVLTDQVAHFNPAGRNNCTPDGANAGSAPSDYPTFLDPNLTGSPTPQTPWTLAKAARHLLFVFNGASNPLVANPSGTRLDSVLVSREPIDGTPYDPNDSSTYTTVPITVPDKPITGKDWPGVLADLTDGRGIGWAWRINVDGSGYPSTSLDVFWLQQGSPKDLYLQARGQPLDGNLSNVAECDLLRDLTGVANAWSVEGALLAYEASFVLAPAFPMAAADAASSASLAAYDLDAIGAGAQDSYRTWVFDECGEGHYAQGSATPIRSVPSLGALLGTNPGDFVVRRRPPIGDLFTVDSKGKPLRHRLAISTNYAGAAPGLWAPGPEVWQAVDGGYELLRDRIGVRLTCHNPNGWPVGESDLAGAPFPDGVVKVIQCLAAPDGSNPPFKLRLTCVIEGDRNLSAKVTRRTPASPLPYPVTRRVDARDRLEKDTIAAHSEFNVGATPVVSRDDTAAAMAEATAYRTAAEAGELAGNVVIRRFTMNYRRGDLIRSISGRGLGLRTDGGGPTDPPVYPVVAAIRWELAGEQRTVLTLSDGRGRPRGHAPEAPRPAPAAEVTRDAGDFAAPTGFAAIA